MMDLKNLELVILLLFYMTTEAFLGYGGTKFIFGFIGNNSTLSPNLYVIPHQGKDAFIRIKVPLDPTFKTITVTAPHGEVTSIPLSPNVRMANGRVDKKGIVLISDQDIIVYGRNPTNGTSDVYLILPIEDIGDEYMLVSHRPTGHFTSNIGITATKPGTQIDITVPNMDRNISLRFGKYMVNEGQTLTVALDNYETAQLESNQDLMGTRITANNPIALVNGETSVLKLWNGTILLNHAGNQMIPVHSWGNSFVSGPNSVTDHLYYIVARDNNTLVNVRKKSHTQPEIYQLEASQTKEINASREDFISIDTDKPVSVQQYLVTHVVQKNCEGECIPPSPQHPSLLFIPPMEQRQHQYLFSSDSGDSSGKKTVNLVIATPLREGMMLNGKELSSYISNSKSPSLNAPKWETVEKANKSYSAIQFLVEEGLHNLSHISPQAEFSATLQKHLPEKELQDLEPASSASTQSLSPETTRIADVEIIQDKLFSGNGAIPTAKVEKSNSNDELNNAYLAKSGGKAKLGEEGHTEMSHSVIAVIVTLCTAVLLVIICIAGFVFAEFAFHNGEKSLFQSARVSPYEPIEPN